MSRTTGGRLAGPPSLLRAINERAVLGHLIDRGPLTRAAVARLTGLSTPTASSALMRLTDSGHVTAVGNTVGGPGRNATLYSVRPDIAFVAAADVRPRSLTTVICDISGKVHARSRRPVSNRVGPVETVVDALVDARQQAGIAADAVDRLELAVPGSYDPATDTIRYVSHVPGWWRPGVIGELRQRLHPLRVAVDNDVNLAAVAERSRGVAGDADWFALLWISSGIGLAVDLGGTLLRGARGGAGEIALMPVGVPGRSGQGAARNLQGLVGGPAVRTLAREYGFRGRSADVAVRRAVQAGPEGRPLLREIAERVAVGLAPVIGTLDPPLVVLGGDVCRAGGHVLSDLVARALGRASRFDTPIAVTTVEGNAVLLGAVDAGVGSLRDELVGPMPDQSPNPKDTR